MASRCAISARVGTGDQARGCERAELSRLAAELDRAGRRMIAATAEAGSAHGPRRRQSDAVDDVVQSPELVVVAPPGWHRR